MGQFSFSLNDLTEKWPRKKFKPGIRAKLLIIFLLAKIIPLILLAFIAWRQFLDQGGMLRDIAVSDASIALNARAEEHIERVTTDAAMRVAAFLHGRDSDVLILAGLEPSESTFRSFQESRKGQVIQRGRWKLGQNDSAWVPAEAPPLPSPPAVSSNIENNDLNRFTPRPQDNFTFELVSYYDEITFLDLDGNEIIKVLAPDSPKTRYPLNPEKRNVADQANTYVKAETYFEELKELHPGQVYVSELIGAYVGTNYIGLYTPDKVAEAAEQKGYAIDYQPEEQAYAGLENPNGQRFEGLIRWASPVADSEGRKIGYVTLALNHDHIMELVDHLTPMDERYILMPSAYEGNYAFIWDYECRNISHPRHHSIYGFDPETGEPQVPWLESSIYEGWKASGIPVWTDYVKDYPPFFEQSRSKAPSPALTRDGLVGLDGRYLNFAPQCVGWMDLTRDGGSGSFYILWSGLYKLTTAAAIPYYTGRYAPSKANGYSRRGFGFVTIGSGLEFFTSPARDMEEKLVAAVNNSLKLTLMELVWVTGALIVVVISVAIWMATFLTNRLNRLVYGIGRYRAGERQFRFHASVKDEFGALADAFDEMADGLAASVKHTLCILNLDKKVVYMNEHGLEVTNKPLDAVVGADYEDISFYPSGTFYNPMVAREEGREPEIYFHERTNRYFKGRAASLFDREGKHTGYIVESLDVTEMVSQKKDMEQAMNEAQKANQHKSEFLARMSHEIRTPMNAILGLTGLVRKSIDEQAGERTEMSEIKDNLKQIEVSSQHLLGLLNDILDISKIEAGKIELSEEAVELPRLAEAVSGIIKPRCDDKNIVFETVFDSFAETTFLTDSLRLRQVLINLLGNAVKFTPALGTITFMMLKKDNKPGETLVEFVIRDTGIGIPQEAQAGIFQPFEQASGRIASQFGGTGLGLAISRHIVRLFGGDIALNSSVDQGSEFRFSIWLHETETRLAGSVTTLDPTGKFTGLKVLLVDDVDLNRKIVKAMLRNTGLEIDEAGDGSEAVEKFQERPENFYSLILMDILMPHMGGYEATRAIRALPRADAGVVPVVALTANAFTEDIDQAMSAGMNAHLAKPVKRELLVEILFRFLAPSI